MKRYLLPLAFLGIAGITASAAEPPVYPTVREGSHFCFPGMDRSKIRVIPAAPDGINRPGQARGVRLEDHRWDNADGHDIREIKTQGTMHVLVLLVDYADTKMSVGDGNAHDAFHQLLNGDPKPINGSYGSANAFYRTVSGGQFDPVFDVVGPIQVSKASKQYVNPDAENVEHYTDADGKEQQVYPAAQMIMEAVRLADADIDYSKYDYNGDGYVDFVYVFHAGMGATSGGDMNTTIWPHATTLEDVAGGAVELDGVKINRYATSCELDKNRVLVGPGLFTHEFGHVLGLPDMYNTTNQTASFTPGSYDVMDAGEYNDDMRTPPAYTLYERYGLEWTKPVEITGGGSFTLLPLTARSFGYKIPTARKATEYFLLEARAQHGWDSFIEGNGLLAWHIDFVLDLWDRNRPNNVPNHQYIDIVEADDVRDSASRAGDVFPGTAGICEFEPYGQPAFQDWSGNGTGYSLRNIIRNADGSVSFNIEAEDGSTMTGLDLKAPAPRLTAATSTTLTVEWDSVEGATGYMASIYPLAKFDGVLIREFAPGYYFKDLGEATNLTAEGLEPDTKYGVILYAYNDVTAARSELTTTAVTGNTSWENAASPNVYATCDDGIVDLRWDAVEEADDYELGVAERSPKEETLVETAGFDGSKLPAGWSASNPRYETRDRYCGESAPALSMLVGGEWLQTPVFNGELISNISMRAQLQYEEDPFELLVYGTDLTGNLWLVKRITEIQEGNRLSIDFPMGMTQAKLVYNPGTTALNLYLDDIAVTTGYWGGQRAEGVDIEYSADKLSAKVSGLQPDTEYCAMVMPKKNGQMARRFGNYLYFTPSTTPSEVEGILTDASSVTFTVADGMVVPSDSEAVYSIYSIDGSAVALGVRGAYTLPARGLYILSAGAAAMKAIW